MENGQNTIPKPSGEAENYKDYTNHFSQQPFGHKSKAEFGCSLGLEILLLVGGWGVWGSEEEIKEEPKF